MVEMGERFYVTEEDIGWEGFGRVVCVCLCPFRGVSIRKNRKGYCRNLKQKDVSTQFLLAYEFLEEIQSYVSNLSQEDCCILVQGEARKYEFIKFIANKPIIVKVVALVLKKYFDLGE